MTGSDIFPMMNECKCVKINDDIWYSAVNYNAVCKISLLDGSISIESAFVNERFEEEFLSTQLISWKDEIVFIPFQAKYPQDYHLKEHTMNIIKGKEAVRDGNSYFNAHIFGNICYMFPFMGDRAIRVNMYGKKIESYINVGEIFYEATGERYHHFSRSDCYEYNGKLYLAMFDHPHLAEMDLQSQRIKFYKIEGNSQGFIHLGGIRDKIYLMNRNGECVLWNISSKAIRSITPLQQKAEEITRFYYTASNDQFMYFFKFVATDEFVKIDVETDECKVCKIQTEWDFIQEKEDSLIFLMMDNRKFYFFSVDEKELVVVDEAAGRMERIGLSANSGQLEEYVNSHVEEELQKGVTKQMIYEGKYVWSLENLLKHGLADRSNERKVSLHGQGVGADILRETAG